MLECCSQGCALVRLPSRATGCLRTLHSREAVSSPFIRERCAPKSVAQSPSLCSSPEVDPLLMVPRAALPHGSTHQHTRTQSCETPVEFGQKGPSRSMRRSPSHMASPTGQFIPNYLPQDRPQNHRKRSHVYNLEMIRCVPSTLTPSHSILHVVPTAMASLDMTSSSLSMMSRRSLAMAAMQQSRPSSSSLVALSAK